MSVFVRISIHLFQTVLYYQQQCSYIIKGIVDGKGNVYSAQWSQKKGFLSNELIVSSVKMHSNIN